MSETKLPNIGTNRSVTRFQTLSKRNKIERDSLRMDTKVEDPFGVASKMMEKRVKIPVL